MFFSRIKKKNPSHGEKKIYNFNRKLKRPCVARLFNCYENHVIICAHYRET